MGNGCLKGNGMHDQEPIATELHESGVRAEQYPSMAPNVSQFSQKTDNIRQTPSFDSPKTKPMSVSQSMTSQFSEAVSNFPNVLNISQPRKGGDLAYGVPESCRIVEDSILLDQIGSNKGTDYFRGESNTYGLSLVKCVTVDDADEDTLKIFETELNILTFIQRSSRKSRKREGYRTKSPFKSGYETTVFKHQNDNIIGFIGYMEAYVDNSRLQRRLITEFYVDTLREHIRHRTENGRRDMRHYEAGLYAFQMAKGLVAIHNLKIIHRDLNSDNVIMGLGLLDREYKDWLRYIAKQETKRAFEKYPALIPAPSDNKNDAVMQRPNTPRGVISYYKFLQTPPLVAKLANFGYAKTVTHGRTRTVIGSMQFMAPEMMKQEHYSHSADIWSFGCVLYEMIQGNAPFHKKQVSYIESKVLGGKFPRSDNIGSKTFSTLQTIMRNCLKTEPALRSKAKELVSDLGKL